MYSCGGLQRWRIITPVEAENKFETFISRIRHDFSQENFYKYVDSIR